MRTSGRRTLAESAPAALPERVRPICSTALPSLHSIKLEAVCEKTHIAPTAKARSCGTTLLTEGDSDGGRAHNEAAVQTAPSSYLPVPFRIGAATAGDASRPLEPVPLDWRTVDIEGTL